MLVTTENLVDIGPHGAEDRYLAPSHSTDGNPTAARYLLSSESAPPGVLSPRGATRCYTNRFTFSNLVCSVSPDRYTDRCTEVIMTQRSWAGLVDGASSGRGRTTCPRRHRF
jgi:hypothetical protein